MSCSSKKWRFSCLTLSNRENAKTCLKHVWSAPTQIVIKIRALIEELKKSRNVIDFNWIPSQSENRIELNVEADCLAKESAQPEEVSKELRHLKMTFRQVRSLVRNSLHEAWTDFFPDLVNDWSRNFSRIKNLDKIANFYTSQFIKAHGMFNEYRHRFKLSEDLLEMSVSGRKARACSVRMPGIWGLKKRTPPFDPNIL